MSCLGVLFAIEQSESQKLKKLKAEDDLIFFVYKRL